MFSLAPEPSDDEVSSTSSLVSRLKQVKVMKLIKVIINLLISDCRQGEKGEAPVARDKMSQDVQINWNLLDSFILIQGGMESGRKDNTKQTNELLLRAL